jgi:hypothetical protein
VRALLDAPESPLRPAARPRIEGLIERGLGIELRNDGAWFSWNPADGIPAPPMPPPIATETKCAVYALLTTLSTSEIKTPRIASVATLPPVKASPTLRAARAQLASHQSVVITLRDAIANNSAGAMILRADAEREGKTRAIACASRLRALVRLAPTLTRAAANVDAIRATLMRAVDEALDELHDRTTPSPSKGHHLSESKIARSTASLVPSWVSELRPLPRERRAKKKTKPTRCTKKKGNA